MPAAAAAPAAPAASPPPAAPEIGSLPIAQLLDLEPNWTGLGSFKFRLPKYGIAAYTHGITELLFAAQSQEDPARLHLDLPGTPTSFAGNFDLFVGAELRSVLFTELELILTSDGGRVDVNFAQIDLRVFRDFLIVRGGKFLVPIGGLNLYPDPFFVFKLPELPQFYNHIIPSRWGELGVQLYGRYSWGESRALSYAFYVSNGLEQKDSMAGGDIGLMKDNLRDSYDADKAFGGQIQVEPIRGFSFGISGYSGIYTQTNHLRLSMADFHIGFQHKNLNIRGEVATAFQEIENGMLNKLGVYGLISYRVIRYIEPAVMIDWLGQGGDPVADRLTGTVGIQYYPYPQKVPSGALRLGYGFSWDGNWSFAGHRFSALLVVGF